MPDTHILQTWVDTLSRWGYRSVRTSPLAPGATAALSAVGFTPVQDLTLLERISTTSPIIQSQLPTAAVRFPFSRFPRTALTRTIIEVDREAFGDEWMMDQETFEEALRATRRSRIFVSHVDGALSGFVIAGVTDSYGFIQRLAVRPACRRRGEATNLVQTALSWIHSRGCSSTVVNTETSNVSALSIYKKCGFTPMEYGLTVMERQLVA